MERFVEIQFYQPNEVVPYPSELGVDKEYIEPKLARMIKENPRFKRMLEEVELKLIEK